MPRLIWVFAVRTITLLVLSCRRLICSCRQRAISLTIDWLHMRIWRITNRIMVWYPFVMRCLIFTENCQGHRCSFYGYCDDTGMCHCPKCDASAGTQQVCGSDGVTYENECQLQKFACTEKKMIHKKSEGACPESKSCLISLEVMLYWQYRDQTWFSVH